MQNSSSELARREADKEVCVCVPTEHCQRVCVDSLREQKPRYSERHWSIGRPVMAMRFDRVPEAHTETNGLGLEASAAVMMVVMLGTPRDEERWGGWWGEG